MTKCKTNSGDMFPHILPPGTAHCSRNKFVLSSQLQSTKFALCKTVPVSLASLGTSHLKDSPI